MDLYGTISPILLFSQIEMMTDFFEFITGPINLGMEFVVAPNPISPLTDMLSLPGGSHRLASLSTLQLSEQEGYATRSSLCAGIFMYLTTSLLASSGEPGQLC